MDVKKDWFIHYRYAVALEKNEDSIWCFVFHDEVVHSSKYGMDENMSIRIYQGTFTKCQKYSKISRYLKKMEAEYVKALMSLLWTPLLFG